MNHVSAKTMGVVAITYPSETIFSSELKVNSIFSTPLSVSPGGLAMDADRLMSLVKALDGNKDKQVQFMLNSGANSSALEHSVPEQLFSSPENPAQGISAVKALQLANEQGIPIYTINQTNIGTILPQLQLDAGTIADIQSAVNAGKVVTVSKTDITFNGWTGCGYIIIDPNTGAGAYMISGGMNGAWLILALSSFLVLLFITAATLTAFGVPPAIALLLAGVWAERQMLAFINSIHDTLDLLDAGKITADAAEQIIVAKCMITIMANITGYLSKLLLVDEQVIVTTVYSFVMNQLAKILVSAF